MLERPKTELGHAEALALPALGSRCAGMDSAATLATRANEAVAVALTHDEQGRASEAVTSYRWARALLDKAAGAAPAASPLAASMLSRKRSVDQRLEVLVQRAARPGLRPQSHPQGHVQVRAPLPSLPEQRQQHNRAPPQTMRSDPAMIAAVEAEIMETAVDVSWDDVAGCEEVKEALQELLIRPTQRPDLYVGIRSPAKGLLLFGSPGTGKTLCAKAAATECASAARPVTFFSVSASALSSKWHGESEKLMRALFEVARARQPSFIFFDEVDSILSARGGSGEHEASRKLKTEFLTQVDGAGRAEGEAVYVMAATNRPQDLDDAVLRRLSKRIHVPLPRAPARLALLRNLTVDSTRSRQVKWDVSPAELKVLATKMRYFSGADIHALVREASLLPLRELSPDVLSSVDAKKVRGVSMADFERALAHVKPTVSKTQLAELEQWDREFGVGGSDTGTTSATAPPGSKAPKGMDILKSTRRRKKP